MPTNRPNDPQGALASGDRHVDVAIIGGGPAGTAAALTLLKRAGLKVLVIEQSDYSAHKVGESLSPGTRSLLEYLEVWQAFTEEQTLQTWGNEAAWGSDDLGSLDFMFTVHGAGWGLDRALFDRLLASHVRTNGGTVESCTRCTDLHFKDGRWTLALSHADTGQKHITADYIIDAGGRNSRWSVQHGAVRQHHDKLIGVAALVSFPKNLPLKAMTQVEACPYGWWYAAPVPGNQLTIALMSDSDVIRANSLADPEIWLEHLMATRHFSALLAHGRLTNEAKPFPAFSAKLRPGDNRRIIAAGDAIASHDPLSSNGIPHALGSGIQAARVAADELFGEGTLRSGYIDAINRDYAAYLASRWRYYRAENRWPDAKFWRYRTTDIALDPQSLLVATSADREAVSSIFISKTLGANMLAQAKTPIPAHQLVSYLKNQAAELPDERAILAIQDLVGRHLAQVPPSGTSS